MDHANDSRRAALYADRLTQQATSLQKAVLNFMVATLQSIIPEDKFAAIFRAGCAQPEQEKQRSVIDRNRVWEALPDNCGGQKKPRANSPAFDDYLKKVLTAPVSPDLRRELLGKLDMQACFKLFVYLPEDKAGCSMADLARQHCPRLASMRKFQWEDLFHAAIHLRNDFAHASTASSKPETAAAWQKIYEPWMQVVDCLRSDAVKAEYDEVHRIYDEAAAIAFYSAEDIAKEMQGLLTADQVREMLGQSGFSFTDGFVDAPLNNVLGYLSDAVRREEERAREEREREELRAENEALAAQNRAFQQQQDARRLQEEDIRLRMAQKKLDGIPALDLLASYAGGSMDQRTLQELVRTHQIILTPSLLKSAGGKYFLGSRLYPAARTAGRPLLLVERTAMLRLIRDIDRLDALRQKYQLLAPMGPAYAPQRQDLEQEIAPLEQSKGTYVFAMDQLKVKLTGVADPLYTDDEALVRTLQDHPFERYCVFVSGATSLPKLIDRARLPFVTVVRVQGNELVGVDCMVLRHFLPFAAPSLDDPLVMPLVKESFVRTDRLLKEMMEENASPLSKDRTAPAETARDSAAPAAAPAPAPAPAPVSAPAPTPVSASDPAGAAFPRVTPSPAAPASAPAPAAEMPVKKPQAAPAPAPATGAPVKTPQAGPGPGTTAKKPQAASPARQKNAPFPKDPPLRVMDETLLPFPGEGKNGMVLYTEEHRPVTLRGLLTEDGEPAEGGEGTLFLTDSEGIVAKIYNREHLTVGRRDKLTEMLAHDPGMAELCWPTHMLYTETGDFCGYTMPRAPQNALPFAKSVLKIGSPSQRQALMANWTRKDLIRTALAAARIMAQLHKHNILMGDVNGGNFMVDLKNSGRVYVVDTDSFQFGGFPCPVGIEKFTHPGIRERLNIHGALDFKTILRTESEDDYAFAILLFEILFLGQNPFATKTDLDFTQAMAQRRFAYAEVERNSGDFEVPDGDNWMIWKNLPKKVCEAFGRTFLDWHSTTAAEWADLMSSYLYCVERLGFSDELAPAKYHEFNPENPTYVDLVCPFCHRAFNLHKKQVERLKAQGKPIFCRNCLNSLENHKNDRCRVTCSSCGKVYETSVEDAVLIESGLAEALCDTCRHTTVTCDGCGKTFLMEKKRLAELKAKGVREIYCSDCRTQVTVPCESCGNAVQMLKGRKISMEKKGQHIYCSQCWNRTPVTCGRCGTRFLMPVWQQIQNRDKKRSPLCDNCRKQIRARRR